MGRVERKPDVVDPKIKGADQPTHSPSLISAFVVRPLESIIDKFLHAKFQLSSYMYSL